MSCAGVPRICLGGRLLGRERKKHVQVTNVARSERFAGAQREHKRSMMIHVGLVGFEPTASWSRTRRSTKLSHSPNWISHASMANRRARYFAYFAADSKEIEPMSA